ncbi:PQQ-dependent sugar dehydrogenase [Micromonospora sp. MH99]|uniref:PQQ-dependent sugar dehydrogenase n=1 Tax=Micromonospora sp. MH99 TaxID=1945510 RepID=UPI001F4544C0|nr:PQQ-dependent sugar dehydrogenase [Micromonospora sp. MH99]MCF0091452.1 Extracellular exo-alpha-L-arabinofuranosidase [Micromonospora sp. MH99]
MRNFARVRPRRLVPAFAVAVLLAAAVGVPASAAGPSTVVGVASGRCLDVVGNSRTPGAGINIYDCVGQANQAWTFTAAGELRAYDATMCLDVVGQDTSAPAALQIYGCTGGANQRWRINADGSIVGVQSGLCLDVTGGGTANGTTVGLWTCNGQANQRWTSSLGSTDSQPPTPPGNPRVSGLTCNSVTFAWNASTDNVAVAFYDIYHDGQLMTSVNGGTLSASLTVVPGATWGLYVNARDAAGNVSQASATVTITPPPCQADTVPPSTPTQLTGTASGTTVTLRWTASSDNVGVRAYDVYRNGVKIGTVTGAPPATTFTDSGLAANTMYQYQVLARDGQDNASARSASVAVSTGGACANPVCTVRQVTTDTDVPWGLVTLPDGTVLYNRRDAHDIIHLNPTTGTKTTVGTVPNVQSTDGEGGLLGLAISSSFASDRWLYIMHTSPSDNRIVRIKMENDRLTTASEQVLLSGIRRNKYHNGGRLRFGPDGKLYASTGDAQNGAYAQDRSSLEGKILRLNPDGGVPSDNPFGNYVWSYGHRNPQGLAFDSQGRLWEQEFGNSIMDETNLITRGGNYGWPACEGTSGTCGTAGYIAPARTYPTAEGSCSGIAIVRDALYVACARGTRMYRAVISGSSLTNVQTYFSGTYGRLRTVEPAPDGGLWLTTTNTGDKDSTPNNSNERVLHVTLGN